MRQYHENLQGDNISESLMVLGTVGSLMSHSGEILQGENISESLMVLGRFIHETVS